MNRGDTVKIILDYTVDGAPIAENDFDEIEFTIGSKRYTLTGQTPGVVWDGDLGAYTVTLSQADTMALQGRNNYQIRLKKGSSVVSSGISTLTLGKSISRTTI